MQEIATEVKQSICATDILRAELKKAVENLKKPEISARTRKIAENKIKKQISTAFSFHGNEIQFLGTQLPSLFREVEYRVKNGFDVDEEMRKAVQRFRLN